MLKLEQTKTFKKSLKRYQYNKPVLEELKNIVALLVEEKPIPAKYRDHELKGKYSGFRELHLKPDDLLLYIKVHNEKSYAGYNRKSFRFILKI